MIATLLLTGLLSSPVQAPQDAWDIKPSFTANKAITYKIVTEANMEGQDATAKMDLVVTPGEASENGERKAKMEWQKLELNGQEMDMAQQWQTTLGKDGLLREVTEPKDDEYRRFLSIYSFAYPEKAVKVGDKWTVDVTPKATGAKKMSYTFEAKEVTKLDGKDVLKVASTQKEQGDSGLKSDGTWWLSREGKILKFKLDVKSWTVPFANIPSLDAVITGDAK